MKLKTILFLFPLVILAACVAPQTPEKLCYDQEAGVTGNACASTPQSGVTWSGDVEVGVRSHVPAGEIYVAK